VDPEERKLAELRKRVLASMTATQQKALRLQEHAVTDENILAFLDAYDVSLKATLEQQWHSLNVCLEDVGAVRSKMNGPVDLKTHEWCLQESREMASQFLVGLSAGLKAGKEIDEKGGAG
jgi:hypothetical protein